jgi:hypothetical protein
MKTADRYGCSGNAQRMTCEHDHIAVIKGLWCEILRRRAGLEAIDDLLTTPERNLARFPG